MSHKVSWLIPNKVFHAQTFGNVTLEVATQVNSAYINYLDQGNPPVHILIDISNIRTPLNVMQIRNSQTYLQHPYLGWVVVCGASPFLKFAATIVTNMVKTKFKMVGILEEGISFLKEIEPTLDWSRVNIQEV